MNFIYFIIFILFVVYLVWTWNSTKEFEDAKTRISFMLVGTLFITVLTLIIFAVSRIGVQYPKEEMIGQVRKIILLVFVPINGFIVLVQGARIIANTKKGMLSKEQLSKRIKIFAAIFVIMIILECIYFKNIQLNMINYINTKI